MPKQIHTVYHLSSYLQHDTMCNHGAHQGILGKPCRLTSLFNQRISIKTYNGCPDIFIQSNYYSFHSGANHTFNNFQICIEHFYKIRLPITYHFYKFIQSLIYYPILKYKTLLAKTVEIKVLVRHDVANSSEVDEIFLNLLITDQSFWISKPYFLGYFFHSLRS